MVGPKASELESVDQEGMYVLKKGLLTNGMEPEAAWKEICGNGFCES